MLAEKDHPYCFGKECGKKHMKEVCMQCGWSPDCLRQQRQHKSR